MAEEATVRVTLRRSVGRGGKYYGPGPADVPESFAKSLIANGAATAVTQGSETTSAASSDATADSASASSGESSTPSGEAKAEAKPATKAALKEYGDAEKLRDLATAKGVRVKKDATKAELVDALHAADISLDA